MTMFFFTVNYPINGSLVSLVWFIEISLSNHRKNKQVMIIEDWRFKKL